GLRSEALACLRFRSLCACMGPMHLTEIAMLGPSGRRPLSVDAPSARDEVRRVAASGARLTEFRADRTEPATT
ncbi:MAG: hypothetical protein QOF66_1581, partial [Mycobacterium sp.]|nr:hypothetical protein [Mycobacterium sp.]